MQVFDIPIDQLIFYYRKLRKSDRAVNRMMAAIKEYDFPIPILARHRAGKIEVVDGELRVTVAIKLKMPTIPVVFCDEWTDAQVMAFRLLANRSATWAKWDKDLVALELKDLDALEFDLGLTGFDPFEIDEFLFSADPKADLTLGFPKDVDTLAGDLWRCGEEHRVLCGDATSPEAVNKLFGEAKAKLLLTDPPYGVMYKPKWREEAGLGQARQTGIVANDDRADWTAAYKLFTGDVAYVWHAAVHASEVAAGLEACGFKIRAQIVWVKQHFALSRGDYNWRHEPAWYAVRKGKSSNWSGDRKQSTVWEVDNLNPFGNSGHESATGHGTEKPVEIFRRPMLNNARPGEIVYDPFLGSGTTLVAAEVTDRMCYGMEVDPTYVDMIVTRWQDLTGKKAVLEADGRTFEQVTEERKPKPEVEECPA
jgi:DNA modification methylase